jgi:hypothetical protein
VANREKIVMLEFVMSDDKHDLLNFLRESAGNKENIHIVSEPEDFQSFLINRELDAIILGLGVEDVFQVPRKAGISHIVPSNREYPFPPWVITIPGFTIKNLQFTSAGDLLSFEYEDPAISIPGRGTFNRGA